MKERSTQAENLNIRQIQRATIRQKIRVYKGKKEPCREFDQQATVMVNLTQPQEATHVEGSTNARNVNTSLT